MKTNNPNVVRQGKALAGRNKNTEGQRALVECYKNIQDLLPQTPASVWNAWVRLGRRTNIDGTNLKSRRSWKR